MATTEGDDSAERARVQEHVEAVTEELAAKGWSQVGYLGHGGFGVAMAATGPDLGRRVLKAALKLEQQEGESDDVTEALLAEATSLSSLSHPHIVQYYELVRLPSAICISMEFMKGGSVWDYMMARPGPLHGDTATRL